MGLKAFAVLNARTEQSPSLHCGFVLGSHDRRLSAANRRTRSIDYVIGAVKLF